VTPTRAIGGQTPIEERHRIECGDRLVAMFESSGLSRKQLLLRIENDYAIRISEQRLSYWLQGKWLPNSVAQAAIAGVFGIPVQLIWPPIKLEKVA
jgi:transcriptional regulator with XRE-family HTH domain